MAKRIKQEKWFGGIEDSISKFSYFFLILGIAGFSIGVLTAIVEVIVGPKASAGELFFLKLISFGILSIGITMFIIFQAVAETIRLLKKQNSLPYSGIVSTPTSKKLVICCSNCNKPIKRLRFIRSRCAYCGQYFEKI